MVITNMDMVIKDLSAMDLIVITVRMSTGNKVIALVLIRRLMMLMVHTQLKELIIFCKINK